jgi:hypothetical protein
MNDLQLVLIILLKTGIAYDASILFLAQLTSRFEFHLWGCWSFGNPVPMSNGI